MKDANAIELELTQDLSRFINDIHNNRRIIVGCLKEERLYIIFTRPRIFGGKPLLQISEPKRQGKMTFKYIPLSMLNAPSIALAIRNHLEDDFTRLIVDVHSAKDKRSMITKDAYMHLVEPQNADEIRKAKLERKIFNNPKLWVYSLPTNC